MAKNSFEKEPFYTIISNFFFKISHFSYRILEMLYSRDKDYVKLLRTYIDDHFRQNQVFNFVQKTLSEDDNDKKGQVEKSVLDDIDALIR